MHAFPGLGLQNSRNQSVHAFAGVPQQPQMESKLNQRLYIFFGITVFNWKVILLAREHWEQPGGYIVVCSNRPEAPLVIDQRARHINHPCLPHLIP